MSIARYKIRSAKNTLLLLLKSVCFLLKSCLLQTNKLKQTEEKKHTHWKSKMNFRNFIVFVYDFIIVLIPHNVLCVCVYLYMM